MASVPATVVAIEEATSNLRKRVLDNDVAGSKQLLLEVKRQSRALHTEANQAKEDLHQATKNMDAAHVALESASVR
jgi:cell division GTPase FtsZ